MSKKRRNERRKLRRETIAKTGNVSGLSGRSMKKALSQIQTDEVDGVIEVIIRTEKEDIILEDPEVTVMNMGQEIWNIIPKSKRTIRLDSDDEDVKIEIREEDINFVMQAAKVSREEAENALEKNNGDIASAIKDLQ